MILWIVLLCSAAASFSWIFWMVQNAFHAFTLTIGCLILAESTCGGFLSKAREAIRIWLAWRDPWVLAKAAPRSKSRRPRGAEVGCCIGLRILGRIHSAHIFNNGKEQTYSITECLRGSNFDKKRIVDFNRHFDEPVPCNCDITSNSFLVDSSMDFMKTCWSSIIMIITEPYYFCFVWREVTLMQPRDTICYGCGCAVSTSDNATNFTTQHSTLNLFPAEYRTNSTTARSGVLNQHHHTTKQK
jgi:hypothetical protein